LLVESGRVEAFSDGVLAIAITLLVLDLKVPEDHVAHALLAAWPTYLAYLSAFLYIGVVWVNHHALFTRIASVDAGLLWCNLALLLTVSVLPFPTAVLASAMNHGTHGDQVAAVVLYAIVQSLMALSWYVIYGYLMRRPHLLAEGITADFFRGERARPVIGIVAPVIAVLVSTVSPRAALATYVILPVFYAVTAQGWAPRTAGPDPAA
jgi:uncharacterized membrane protein